MDTQYLFDAFKTPPSSWTLSEIQEWLRIIEMPEYSPNFANFKLDGQTIFYLDDQDFEESLGITNRIHQQKLKASIILLKKFEKDFESQQRMRIEQHQGSGALDEFFLKKSKEFGNIPLWEMLPPFANEINYNVPKNDQMEQKMEQEGLINFIPFMPLKQNLPPEYPSELVIQPVRGGFPNCLFLFDVKGGGIGRRPENNIMIDKSSVSDFHGKIEFFNNRFHLVDLGSEDGSFIKITNPLILEEGMIIEMGSNHFLVKKIDIQVDEFPPSYFSFQDRINSKLFLEIIGGDNSGEILVIQKWNALIGRMPQCTISFPGDLYLSKVHARIAFYNSKFIFEDYNGTNGSWRRLSKKDQKSNHYELSDQAIIKIGTSSTFQVIRSQAYSLKMMLPEKVLDSFKNCCICFANERDIVFEPCRHLVVCSECYNKPPNCPMCRAEIRYPVKIYKN